MVFSYLPCVEYRANPHQAKESGYKPERDPRPDPVTPGFRIVLDRDELFARDGRTAGKSRWCCHVTLHGAIDTDKAPRWGASIESRLSLLFYLDGISLSTAIDINLRRRVFLLRIEHDLCK